MPVERGELGRLIDGTSVAAEIRAEVAVDAAALVARGVTPGLTVVLVGDDPASAVYVRGKAKACAEAGMKGDTILLPASTSQADLLALVARLNADPTVHGILVQMPLPPQIDPASVVLAIDPRKDVDGFHPVNVGKVLVGDSDGFAPCTPAGVRELLLRYDVQTAGAECVIVGRSNIVGRPMAALMMQGGPAGDATVTVCHSRTRDLAAHTREADILIVAAGRPKLVTANMVKPGATVIDVGTTRVDDARAKRGYYISGDVDFAGVREVAGLISPVPGGVGPMTIAMLMKNTVRAAAALEPR